MQVRRHASKTSTLALKPRADITRSPKEGYQWPHKKDLCPPTIIFEKKGNGQIPCDWVIISNVQPYFGKLGPMVDISSLEKEIGKRFISIFVKPIPSLQL